MNKAFHNTQAAINAINALMMEKRSQELTK
jgi:hypothetical protein